MIGRTRVFFASDVHASNVCFRKFLNAGKHYGADVLIIGGDITGKGIVPIVRRSNGSSIAYYTGEAVKLDTEAEITALEQRVGDQGLYGFRCDEVAYSELLSSGEAQAILFKELIEKRIADWVQLADERMAGQGRKIYLSAGNDDMFSIDEIIDRSSVMKRPEGKVEEIDEYVRMISCGFANVTPFRCPRDIPEKALREKIDAMARHVGDFSKCIFNLHCPPYGTVLDRAPKLDKGLQPRMTGFGIEECSAGSTAVRDAIVEYEPCLGLHGHIHESAGICRIGSSTCANPGSEYQAGLLRGVLAEFSKGKLTSCNLTDERRGR